MGFGLKEIIIVGIIVLILFGAGKISNFMKELGKGASSFKKGLKEGDEDSPLVEDKAPPEKMAFTKEEAKKGAKKSAKTKKKHPKSKKSSNKK